MKTKPSPSPDRTLHQLERVAKERDEIQSALRDLIASLKNHCPYGAGYAAWQRAKAQAARRVTRIRIEKGARS